MYDANTECATYIANNPGSDCECQIPFSVDEDVDDTLYLYYRLTNFYQNHRIYVRSRDNAQLAGKQKQVEDPDSLSSDCEPYRTTTVFDPVSGQNVTRGIAPCGTIANSMSTDLFSINQGGSNIFIEKRGIAWTTDHETKFNNPDGN